MKSNCKQLFDVYPITKHRTNGTTRISFYYVELSNYVKVKRNELFEYLEDAPKEHKLTYLKSFYDDEGGVIYSGRRVIGCQYCNKTLTFVQKMLKEFGIKGKINSKQTQINITRKENLIKFRDNINFSPGIYINPNRKNSIWNKKIEKKEIVDLIIDSYE